MHALWVGVNLRFGAL